MVEEEIRFKNKKATTNYVCVIFDNTIFSIVSTPEKLNINLKKYPSILTQCQNMYKEIQYSIFYYSYSVTSAVRAEVE